MANVTPEPTTGGVTAETRADVTPEPRAYVRVEREGEDRYKILASDLETIGQELRGKPRFSVFNSIIVPAVVTIVTFVLTGVLTSFFQYISWRNSINLQAASDQAAAASKTYDTAASESEKRFYTTLLFQAAVKNLANQKTTTDAPLLNQYDTNLQKRRFEGFYTQLLEWNQTYSQLLPDISYNMDRPVFPTQWTDNGYVIKSEILDKVNCDVKSLTDELQANNLDRFHLTNHFAVINKCFSDNLLKFATLKDRVLSNKGPGISGDEFNDANDALYGVRQMVNEFRCYALTRIHYLNALKERAVFLSVWFTPKEKSVQQHFVDTSNRCKIT